MVYIGGSNDMKFSLYLITTLLLFISVSAFAQTKGALENPSQGSNTSGIYMFSGWACDAELIEIVINGGSGLKAAYGTSRGDTRGICGDSDNGFGLLFNMANLGTGQHTALAFADGLEIGRSTFSVKTMTSGEFLGGAEAETVVKNFPSSGQEAVLTWVESAQNFLISDEYVSANPYDVAGLWGGPLTADGRLDPEGVVTVIITQPNPNNLEVELASAMVNDIDGNTWLFFGSLTEGVMDLDLILPEDAALSVKIYFSSAGEGTVELTSCTPSSYCWGPLGSTFTINKASLLNFSDPM